MLGTLVRLWRPPDPNNTAALRVRSNRSARDSFTTIFDVRAQPFATTLRCCDDD